MDRELLLDLARHQIWADAEHWKALHGDAALCRDEQICKRLSHVAAVCERLREVASGAMPAPLRELASMEEIETAMRTANESMVGAVSALDLDRVISLPRGPKGPFEAPAGVLLLQAIMHGQHHRGQNAARMRELGVKPPPTDFVVWFAAGKP